MNRPKKSKEKAFEKNILLSEDEVMEQQYYTNPAKVKPENQKTRKRAMNEKPLTKPRSFDEPVEKIAVQLPKRLVKKMRAIVVEKESRFNIEAAAAFEAYLKKYRI